MKSKTETLTFWFCLLSFRLQRPVLADEEIEMRALLGRELQKDLFAFGVLEALAVLLEELVRSTLALDPDEQRLAIVDAVAELLGAFGEQPAGGALEEEKRRPRLELRILAGERAVAVLERRKMLALFAGEPLEHSAP